jgi:hypothetical protein
MFTFAWPSEKIVPASPSMLNCLTICLRLREALLRRGLPDCGAARAAQRRTYQRILLGAVAALALSVGMLADRAEAGVSTVPPSMSLTFGIPGDTLTIPVSLTASPGGGFAAEGTQSVASVLSLSYQFNVIADPLVSGSFMLTNITDTTQTFFFKVTLGVLPIAAPTSVSGFYGPVLVTAPIGTPEATLTASPFYQAQIDGATVESLGNISVTTTGGSATLPAEVFSNHPGPAVSSSIGVAFSGFTLTAHDSVQTPFQVTVVSVPEPASGVLLALGLVISLIRWGKLPVGPRKSAR